MSVGCENHCGLPTTKHRLKKMKRNIYTGKSQSCIPTARPVSSQPCPTEYERSCHTISFNLACRLVQYTSRLLWHQLESRNANKYSVDRFKNLELTLGTFRKILRLGRCIDICYTALNTMHIEDPFIRTSLTTSKLAHALYLYADHVVWLAKSGFLKTDSDNWNRTANKFWLLSIIANLARDFYEIYHLLELSKATFLRPSELINGSIRSFDLSVTMKNLFLIINCHKDVFLDTMKNSCDLFIPLTALGFTKLSPSAVGMLGAISSIAALVTIVKPITKLVPA